MPVNAVRLIRKMRGGAQAHLIETDDGSFYVVKFRENPQHRRILINELIASVFLRYLQIATPETAMVRITREFLACNPEVAIQLGSTRQPVAPGWHFGSRYPGDPSRVAVYDFLPDKLIASIENPTHFAGVLAFDKWMGNADARQAVFFRARIREWTPAATVHPLRHGFLALMIDHGYVFDGPHWGFADSPMQGLYFRPAVYESIRGLDDFQPWLDRIVHFPEEVVDLAYRQIPPQWLAGDQDAIEHLLERLLERRRHVPEFLDRCRSARANPFPNWR
ncbi:MAG: HipA family kinase [Bryobacteraceae bacterium]